MQVYSKLYAHIYPSYLLENLQVTLNRFTLGNFYCVSSYHIGTYIFLKRIVSTYFQRFQNIS